ncbi:sigma-70 family RNA polymerase sigma factor [Nocardiopsis terrae]
MTRGNETDVPAAEAVEALHDTFAQQLYRYAWSLLGDPERHGGGDRTDGDPVTDAVHEALVAGIGLEAELTDPADRGPWLYALVRVACQLRGFAHTCPYTRLATVPEEVPVARMFSRLPASHRELVELNLRHALSTSAVSRVLGLEPRICGELSRSAIRRAAEGLDDLSADSPEEESPGALWRTQVQQVSSALALLRPPGAPPGLRARVVHTCTAPEAAQERARIAAAMHPLTADGYPVHRSHPSGAAVVEEPEDSGVGTVEIPLPRALPGDRVTTGDHPVRDDARSPLPAPDHDPLNEVRTPGHRRWPLPAVSGLATVAVAVGLWWWAGSVDGPSTVIDTGPAAQGARSGTERVEASSTASDGKPGTERGTASAPGASVPEAPEDPERGAPEGEEPSPPQEPRDEERGGGGNGSQESPEEELTDAPVPPTAPEVEPPGDGGQESGGGEAGGDEPGDGESDSGSDGLLDGLLGLLFGSGRSQ